tara:strand:- start:1849 stop:2757 length:909 start_codon:yes stop_codon:yes gene_type:complete
MNDQKNLMILYNALNGYDKEYEGYDGWEEDYLDCLDNCEIKAEVPRELGNLTNLFRISLRKNYIYGNIPEELGNLSNLWWMDLGCNLLTGIIPEKLYEAKNLRYLYLDQNKLSGRMSPKIDNLLNLNELVFSHNKLTGPIPVSLGCLTQLTLLNLFDNNLSGYIPHSLLYIRYFFRCKGHYQIWFKGTEITDFTTSLSSLYRNNFTLPDNYNNEEPTVIALSPGVLDTRQEIFHGFDFFRHNSILLKDMKVILLQLKTEKGTKLPEDVVFNEIAPFLSLNKRKEGEVLTIDHLADWFKTILA